MIHIVDGIDLYAGCFPERVQTTLDNFLVIYGAIVLWVSEPGDTHSVGGRQVDGVSATFKCVLNCTLKQRPMNLVQCSSVTKVLSRVRLQLFNHHTVRPRSELIISPSGTADQIFCSQLCPTGVINNTAQQGLRVERAANVTGEVLGVGVMPILILHLRMGDADLKVTGVTLHFFRDQTLVVAVSVTAGVTVCTVSSHVL